MSTTPLAAVIGGSRGIGAAVIERLRHDGWATVDLSRTSGVDVTKPDVLAEALESVRGAQALIYCAGHVEVQELTGLSPEEWAYHLEVNLTGAWHCLRWYAGLHRPGAVVLVSSTAGTRASPGWGAYAASKAALANLALTAAAELSHGGVRVYCVAPGRCATQLRSRLAPDEDQAAIMQPVEVADVVAMLVDDRAGVLAGQVIEVKRR